MPVKKISSIKSAITTSGITSSNLSSSVSGNINLIQSQIREKTNEYINIRNAVNLLEKYSNWNGYIKLYTEVESNFNVNDIIYITYTSPITGSTIFNLDNNYNNDTGEYYDDPFNENINKYSFGYKILYTYKHNNELVINRYYNDITPGSTISHQCLSKVTCRGGNYYDNISDGVVFYKCNIFPINTCDLDVIIECMPDVITTTTTIVEPTTTTTTSTGGPTTTTTTTTGEPATTTTTGEPATTTTTTTGEPITTTTSTTGEPTTTTTSTTGELITTTTTTMLIETVFIYIPNLI